MSKKKRSRTSPTKSSSGCAAAAAASQQPEANDSNVRQLNTDKLMGVDIAASLKGTDLEDLAEIVASLPKQIATFIKDKATLMLDLHRDLKEKEASLALFDKEVINKATGQAVECRPKDCRGKNPITSSRLLKEDEHFGAQLSMALEHYDQILEAYNQEATQCFRIVAKLEVNCRLNKLSRESMETLYSLSNQLMMYEVMKQKRQLNPIVTALEIKELAFYVYSDYMREMSLRMSEALCFKVSRDGRCPWKLLIVLGS
jgi:hypothetical protein